MIPAAAPERRHGRVPAWRWCLLGLVLLASARSLAGTRQVLAPAAASVAEAQIRAALDAGRYADAEQAAEALVAARETLAATTPLVLADAIDLLLEARRRANHATMPGVVEIGQRGLQLRESSLDAAHPALAGTLQELGYVLRLRRRTREARPLLERALSIRERTSGPDSIEAAAARQVLALTDLDVREFAAAERRLQQVLGVAERVQGPDGALVASTCHFLGVTASFQSDFDAAVRWLQRAIDIFERSQGPDFPDLAPSLERLASSTEALGDLAGARVYYERAIALSAQTAGLASQGQYFRLLQFSILLGNLGDMRAALARGDEAVAMAERLQGPASTAVAVALGVAATTRHGLGDYDGARALITRALAIWRQTGGSGQHVGEALGELAALDESQGRLDAALSTTGDALAAFAGMDGDVRLKATVLETRGRVLLALGRDAEARTVIAEARVLNETLDDGEGRSFLAQSLVSLAGVDWRLGRRDEAMAEVTQAIALFTAYHGADHPNVAMARGRQAAFLAEAGDTRAAWQALEDAERAAVAHVRLIGGTLPEREALRYASERPSGIGLALTLATGPRPEPDAARRALAVVIASRGLVLDELAARRHDIAQAHAPEVRTRLDAFVRARARLANLVVRGAGGAPPARATAMLAAARAEREAAEQALADASRPFHDARLRRHAGLAEATAALAPRQALAAFVRFDRAFDARQPGQTAPRSPAAPDRAEYAAFVVSATGEPRLVPLGAAAEIDALVAAWRAQIDAEIGAGGLSPRRLEADYRRAGAALRRRIWDPLVSHLGTSDAVFVVPDGTLHLVDFAALPTGDTRYLLETGPAVHYLLAERDLVRRNTATPGRGLLAMGGPDFDVASAGAEAPGDRSTSGAGVGAPRPGERPSETASLVAQTPTDRRRSAACAAFEALSFSRLDAAAQEAHRVGSLWRQSRRTGGAADADSREAIELTADRATEEAFKAFAPGRRILHLATHGFFLDGRCLGDRPSRVASPTAPVVDESPLLRAGLALAGANRRADAAVDREDGILTAEEITAVDLSGVEWAVLSACDTGIGDRVSGEGVLGLRRAFEMAGARTVIMSLWPVADASASRWMAALYRQRFITGTTTLAAARAASLSLLNEARAHGTSTHPARWAGFIAAGDWR